MCFKKQENDEEKSRIRDSVGVLQGFDRALTKEFW